MNNNMLIFLKTYYSDAEKYATCFINIKFLLAYILGENILLIIINLKYKIIKYKIRKCKI